MSLINLGWGKTVEKLWKSLWARPQEARNNGFNISPQEFPGLSTDAGGFSTGRNGSCSTFPRILLLQLILLRSL